MKALVILQGINDNSGYLLPEIEKSTFDSSIYDKIVYINTEKYFDHGKRNLPFYLSWIPNKQKDYLSDIWVFFLKKKIYKKINKEVTNTVIDLQDQGYTVDYLAHSLGTLIALTSGLKRKPVKVDNFYCLNSPLGIEAPIARYFVQRRVKRYDRTFSCNTLYNLYGEKDYISSQMAYSQSIIEETAKLVVTKTHSVGNDMLDAHAASYALNTLY